MTRKCLGKPSVAALLLLSIERPVHGQSVRIAAWSSYEAVTASQDWSTAGAQLPLAGSRGHARWVAGGGLGRFRQNHVAERPRGGGYPPPPHWGLGAGGGSRPPPFT